MIWWLRARRAHVLLPVGLLSLTVLAFVLRDSTAALPTLSLSGGAETKIMLFAPIPLVSLLALSLDSGVPAAEASGARPVRRFDALLVTGVLLVAAGLCLLLGSWLHADAVLSAARDTVFLAGLFLLFRPFAGSAAIVAPVAWVATVVIVGFRGTDDPYPWALIAEPLDAAHSAAATAVLYLAGIALHLRSPRNLS